MSRLWHREVELIVAKVIPGKFFETREEIRIRNLRVSFQVEKNMESTPNPATVLVHNLAERTRAEIEQDNLQVTLLAGYDGQLAQVFKGDLIKGSSKPEGANWVTRMLLGDGKKAHKHGRVARSYKAGKVNPLALLKDTAKAMGARLPNNMADVAAFQRTLETGVNLSGPAHSEMSRILAANGYSWSIQNGQLQVLPDDGATSIEAILVSPATGMIGTPTFSDPDADKKPPVLSISRKLNPAALPEPGGRIIVDARQVKGLYLVRKATHVGDTRGQAWHTEMEATAL